MDFSVKNNLKTLLLATREFLVHPRQDSSNVLLSLGIQLQKLLLLLCSENSLEIFKFLPGVRGGVQSGTTTVRPQPEGREQLIRELLVSGSMNWMCGEELKVLVH